MSILHYHGNLNTSSISNELNTQTFLLQSNKVQNCFKIANGFGYPQLNDQRRHRSAGGESAPPSGQSRNAFIFSAIHTFMASSVPVMGHLLQLPNARLQFIYVCVSNCICILIAKWKVVTKTKMRQEKCTVL